MERYINYRDNIFKRAILTPICGESPFKTLHKLQNEIKGNTKSVYSNIRGGYHGHLGLVLTYLQYSLISNRPFVYSTCPGTLIITVGTTSHMKSNMCITHTKEVRLFCEVTRFEQALVQHIVSTNEEDYLAYIYNQTTNLINNTVSDVLTHMKDNYKHIILRELLNHDDVIKKTSYHLCEPITTVFSAV